MESSSLQHTSLDLNLNPFRPMKEVPKKELAGVLARADDHQKESIKGEAGFLAEEFDRISSENKKLTEMLAHMRENYNALQSHLMDLESNNSNKEYLVIPRKRKADQRTDHYGNIGVQGNIECSSCSDEESCKRPKEISYSNAKVSRVCVRTDASNTNLAVKDGYQWRKYGQKVTRDNPSPRAYFRCSYAPNCPVKKKVQRSVEDPSVLVATYEGEHNHMHPSRAELSLGSSQCANLGSVSSVSSMRSSRPTVTLDLIQTGLSEISNKKSIVGVEGTTFQQVLLQQMASSLTRDPKFTAALATAISGRILDFTLN
ncbi:WRKY transcription factor 18-like [Juglans microcarpa x Juglans regia]|uniref:WRKY transcription factor 18-like n=1 Tax=Juglans microcarpa x Juglans regia TaxID=2249226 RepID=UPI001B7E80AF|nr:WRKY transcription factor 18-like [Juglans microcarpa x Juglans regia]